MQIDKHNYQMWLTHTINQRIAFQGKLTTERARNIAYKMPMICAEPVANSDEFETDEFNDDISHQDSGILFYNSTILINI